MSKIIKAHSLTGRITDGLMRDSFKAVKRNRGAAGIDKVSIQMFEANLADNLRALMRDLKTGSFRPHPLRRHLIPKNETEFRPLGIPAVRDRVAQEVVRRLLNPIFEPLFHPASYGFRRKRNCHMAVEAALKLHDEGFRDVVDADIQGFFDNLVHPIIMQSLAERVADGNILDLVEKFLKSGGHGRWRVQADLGRHPTRRGDFSASGPHRPQPSGLAVASCRLPVCSLCR